MGRRVEQVWPWVLRVAWGSLALTFGPLLGGALADASRPVQLVVVVGAWLVWGVGLVAVLVPHPAGLVGLRGAAPFTLAVGIWATVHTRGAQPEVSSLAVFVGLGAAIVACVVVLGPETGHLCVNGPAYPNERRFLLRPSAVLLLGPVELAAALLCAGAVTGPILLAAKQWVAGAVALLVGAAAAMTTARSLYGMARRFVVFVPAGFVVHDHLTLRDPVLFGRAVVETIRAAPGDTDSLDLTANAPGLAIEVLLREKVEVTRLNSPKDIGETGGTARFLVVPTLPGRLLAEARERRLA